MVYKGVPEDIVLEERKSSIDTIQNIEGILPILKELAPSVLILIANTPKHRFRASLTLQYALIKEKINLQVISLIASSPDEPERAFWEEVSRLLCGIDPLGRTWLYRFPRWLMYKIQGIRI